MEQVTEELLCFLMLTLTFLMVFLGSLNPLEKVAVSIISNGRLMARDTQSATLQ